jgi:hypothetical protein
LRNFPSAQVSKSRRKPIWCATISLKPRRWLRHNFDLWFGNHSFLGWLLISFFDHWFLNRLGLMAINFMYNFHALWLNRICRRRRKTKFCVDDRQLLFAGLLFGVPLPELVCMESTGRIIEEKDVKNDTSAFCDFAGFQFCEIR